MDSTGSLYSRRKFLAALGSVGAAAYLSTWLPGVVEKAYAASEKVGPGSLSDIEHFVFLMQENRSFDHYFGTLSGVRGFDDRTVRRQVVDGKRSTVFQQYGWEVGKGASPTGYTLPFELNSSVVDDDQCLNDPTHDWGPQHLSWNNGRMDNFLRTHLAYDSIVSGVSNAPIVMSHYNRQTLPFYYELADAFTICDNYHCSVLGPTYPNRAYWMSGTLDPDGEAGGPVLMTLSSPLPNPASWGYLRWKTMPESLEEAGVSWKCYQSTDALEGALGGLLMDNILRLFEQYSKPGSVLNNKALVPTIELDFTTDVLLDRLPQVSWIVTDFTGCEHPAAPPSLGGLAVAEVLDILTANPAVWEKTAVILSYDENGGFFDHVAPPAAPRGTPGEWVTKQPAHPQLGTTGGIDGPIGLGFRVPCMVISPYSRGGLVYSGVLDHTSQLRLIESRFDVPVPNLSRWRRGAVGDLTGAFNFAAAPQAHPAGIPAPVIDPYLATDAALNAALATLGDGIPYRYPPNAGIPAQEPGRRNRPSGMVRVESAGHPVSAEPPGSHVPPAGGSGGSSGSKGATGTTGKTSPGKSTTAAVTTSVGITSSSTGHTATEPQQATPSAASPQGEHSLPDTGSSAVGDAVKAAGLIALGGAIVGLANQVPKLPMRAAADSSEDGTGR